MAEFVCGKCGKVYKREASFKKHKCQIPSIPKEVKADSHTCIRCGSVFKTEKGFLKHVCKPKAKKITKAEHTCQFCGKAYKTELGLLKHKCDTIKRLNEKNELFFRYGFMAYVKYYQRCHVHFKPRSEMDFVKSKFYNPFINFGKYAASMGLVALDEYVAFVVRYEVEIKDWTNDEIYSMFISQKIKREDGFDAIERSIRTIKRWSTKNNCALSYYFRAAGAPTIISNIKTGKVSPWLLYHCRTGRDFIGSLSDKEVEVIEDMIDPNFWLEKLKESGHSNAIKSTLTTMGL